MEIQPIVLRAHMIVQNGRVRDILDSEWPTVKAGLEAKFAGQTASEQRRGARPRPGA
jgi:hypothetical protein